VLSADIAAVYVILVAVQYVVPATVNYVTTALLAALYCATFYAAIVLGVIVIVSAVVRQEITFIIYVLVLDTLL